MKTWQKLKQNPQLVNQYLVREKVLDSIRSYFKSQGFHECNTPVLVPTPSCEPNLEFFETTLKTHQGATKRAFLISSPEYSLKKLLTAGLGNIFEITKVFRNEENVSRSHNHEFTMLEWYRSNADYTYIMADFEDLFLSLLSSVQPNTDPKKFTFLKETYDLSKPWPRISVSQAFQQYANIDLDTLLDQTKLKAAHQSKGYQQDSKTTWEQMFYQILFNEIEPSLAALKRPVILYDYPVSQASLSRKKASDPRLAERFEVLLAGLELGNAFSELNDWQEQETRLKADLEERKHLGKLEFSLDEDFIQALKEGMPPAAGIAVGVDRLIMLLADVPSIADTLFFPVAELFNLE
jgi:elongation factor P--(R)-beta-lysine ligase